MTVAVREQGTGVGRRVLQGVVVRKRVRRRWLAVWGGGEGLWYGELVVVGRRGRRGEGRGGW